jgi:hypothetical protein
LLTIKIWISLKMEDFRVIGHEMSSRSVWGWDLRIQWCLDCGWNRNSLSPVKAGDLAWGFFRVARYTIENGQRTKLSGARE